MVLIQMLLPTRAKGEAFSNDLLRQTRREMVKQFGGITAYTRAPASGAWTSPDGAVEQDNVVMVEVLADAFDKSWWREYADVLKKRFSQESIHIRAVVAETLDD
jgi:hypothetical protein